MEFTQVKPIATVLIVLLENNIIIILVRYRCNNLVYDGNQIYFLLTYKNLISVINMVAKSCHEEHDT